MSICISKSVTWTLSLALQAALPFLWNLTMIIVCLAEWLKSSLYLGYTHPMDDAHFTWPLLDSNNFSGWIIIFIIFALLFCQFSVVSNVWVRVSSGFILLGLSHIVTSSFLDTLLNWQEFCFPGQHNTSTISSDFCNNLPWFLWLNRFDSNF